MYKHIIAIIALSIIIVFLQPFVADVLRGYMVVHDWINGLFEYVISDGKMGVYIQDVLSFLVLPFLIALIIALVYRLIKKSSLSCFIQIVWVFWLVLVTALVLR